MTFEEDFLGLKGKAHFITEFKLGETPEETIIAHDGKHKINLQQEPHSFEGKTVNLMDDSCRIYNEKDIKKHCLDKKKVEDVIEDLIIQLDNKIVHYPNMPNCPHCDYNFNDKANSGQKYQIFILREFKKELGLNDTIFGMEIKTDKKLKEGEFRLE